MYKTINKRFYDVFNQPQKIKILVGGGGSGKSVSTIQHMCMGLCSGDGYNRLVLRKYFPALKTSTYLVIKAVLNSWNVNFREQKTEHYFEVGSNRLYYLSLDTSEKIKGSEYKEIWMEEATDFTEDDFQQLTIRLARDKHSEDVTLILTFNPISQDHWCVKLVNQAKADPENYVVMHSTYKDNAKNLSKTFMDRLESYININENFYRVYCLGEPGILKGQIFTNFQIEDSRRWPWNKLNDGLHAYGLDFGWNHPMCLVEVFYSDGEFYVRELFYRSECTTDDLAVWMQTNKVDHTAPIYADAAEPDRISSLCQTRTVTSKITGRELTTKVNRFNVIPARKDVVAGLDYVKSQKIHLCAQSVNGIKEIQNYRYRETRNGDILEEPVKIMDDFCDATRYCLFSLNVNHLHTIPMEMSKGYSFSSSLSVDKFRL